MANNNKLASGKTYHAIRVLIGFYLLYTDYSILKTFQTVPDNQKIPIGVCMAVFAIAGVLLLFFSGKALLKQTDDTEESSSEQNEIAEEARDEELEESKIQIDQDDTEDSNK